MVRIIVRGLSAKSIEALKNAHEHALARHASSARCAAESNSKRHIRAFLYGMASAYDMSGNVTARMKEERRKRIKAICNGR